MPGTNLVRLERRIAKAWAVFHEATGAAGRAENRCRKVRDEPEGPGHKQKVARSQASLRRASEAQDVALHRWAMLSVKKTEERRAMILRGEITVSHEELTYERMNASHDRALHAYEKARKAAEVPAHKLAVLKRTKARLKKKERALGRARRALQQFSS